VKILEHSTTISAAAGTTGSSAPTDEELIIKEARRRRRRRRLAIGVATLVLLGGLIGAVVVLPLGSSDPVHQPTPVLPSLPTAAPAPTGVIPKVAWSDYQGQLHIGDLSGLGEHVVAQTDADPTAPLVALGGGIFWARYEYPTPDQTVDPIADPTVQRFDLATGRTTTLGPGSQVFAAPDRSGVYVATSADELVEYTSGGVPIGHDLRVPTGWFLSASSLLGDPVPVTANGVLVMSAPQQVLRNPRTLALWNPDTGRIRTIGKVWKVIGTYTRPGAPSSLIAWTPASCEKVRNCPLEITDSSTLATRSVYSPFGQGFEWGGGFSPDGSVLAAFVPGPFHLSPTARLVLITGAGRIRAVPGVTINNGDALAWAEWFPDSSHLIVGGVGSPDGVVNDNHFVVSTANRTATPFRFLPNGNDDINFSTVVLP
jgi:hypothetical protein